MSRQVGKWKDCAIIKERMDWSDLCLPAQIYPVVMAGLILFNVYGGHFRHAIHNSVALVVGTFFLWILCAANFDLASWKELLHFDAGDWLGGALLLAFQFNQCSIHNA